MRINAFIKLKEQVDCETERITYFGNIGPSPLLDRPDSLYGSYALAVAHPVITVSSLLTVLQNKSAQLLLSQVSVYGGIFSPKSSAEFGAVVNHPSLTTVHWYTTFTVLCAG